MAYPHSNLNFEKMLMKFITEEGPMLEMLTWLCEKLMNTEVASKINADKKVL